MSLLQRIKDISAVKKISLAELERRSGLSSGSITKWDKSSPSIDKLEKVSNVLNVSLNTLIGKEESAHLDTADLNSDDVIFAFDGREVTPEEKAMLRSMIQAYRENNK